MKINEVEQKVGITKKNIRFYEDQGLIHPTRNRNNGYRNYSKEDINELYKIKLLRKLSVPIKEIHRVQNGEITLEACMESHILHLAHERKNLERMQNICERMESQNAEYFSIDALSYLEQMSLIEEGGIRFMNLYSIDKTKQKKGPWIAAIVVVLIMALFMAILVYCELMDPLPMPLFAGIMCIPIIIIIGTLLALRQRIQEIEGGEQDEANKY